MRKHKLLMLKTNSNYQTIIGDGKNNHLPIMDIFKTLRPLIQCKLDITLGILSMSMSMFL